MFTPAAQKNFRSRLVIDFFFFLIIGHQIGETTDLSFFV